ncbi:hypothetical protein [Anthocerotibacter panamensis]|uniref:hypothetical protein n=1 Tax=Anthocerotibacter panamensis TaxID=2857077 RepID=UPI001C40265E|nr:hypothetical protein [Anthocerotibacter panamensis]
MTPAQIQTERAEKDKYEDIYTALETRVRREKTKPGVDNWEEVQKRHQGVIDAAKISDDKDRDSASKKRLNRELLNLWYTWHPEVQFPSAKGGH